MKNDIGFMQGRLSPVLRGRIQSFPIKNWQKEFYIANLFGIRLMEWTIDSYKFNSNPVLIPKKQNEVIFLSKKYKVKIPSITVDYLMENPFWKIKNNKTIKNNFLKILKGCKKLKIKKVVIPLVDNGSIDKVEEEKILVDYFHGLKKLLKKYKMQVLFESDKDPCNLLRFIKKFDQRAFGINYDIGNSANKGFNIEKEFKVYGKFIKNIHLKDRKYRSKSVRFGRGDADFKKMFNLIKKYKYKGNLILQSARCNKMGNLEVIELLKNFNFIKDITK